MDTPQGWGAFHLEKAPKTFFSTGPSSLGAVLGPLDRSDSEQQASVGLPESREQSQETESPALGPGAPQPVGHAPCPLTTLERSKLKRESEGHATPPPRRLAADSASSCARSVCTRLRPAKAPTSPRLTLIQPGRRPPLSALLPLEWAPVTQLGGPTRSVQAPNTRAHWPWLFGLERPLYRLSKDNQQTSRRGRISGALAP